MRKSAKLKESAKEACSFCREIFRFFCMLALSSCEKMRRPGLEPGRSAWKADILTTILPTHVNSIKFRVLNVTKIRKIQEVP